MFDEPLPSKEDLDLLMKLDKQGDGIIEDLFTIFSYHRPKEYKLYVENIEYNPLDKDKIILDLIFTIQKYNKLVKKEMDAFHQKGKTNKYFSDLYKGAKYFGKSVTAKTCGEILNNLIPKYEQKHLRFKNEFLKKNIFKKSGLLPNTLRQDIEFFDAEVKENGENSYKTIKYIKFIEKLYRNVQKTFKRQTINNTLVLFENQQDKLYQQRQEKIMKRNMEKMRRKEIKLDKKEIEKLKMLNDIANETYQKIMESINKRKLKKRIKKVLKNKKSKSRSKTKSKSKNEKKEIDASKEKEKTKEENNLKTNEKMEENLIESKLNTRYNEKYNRTLSMERMTNGTFFNNNQPTSTTRFMDSKNNTLSNNFTLYNVHKDLLNKLNNLKIRKKKEKEKAIFIPLPIYTKTFSRNQSEQSIFPYISHKGIIDQNKHINLVINPVLNSTTNNFQMLKSSASSPLILNLDSKNKVDSKEKGEHHKKIVKKKKIVNKNDKKSKLDLLIEHQKKIPIIYEQLRKIKNLLNMSRRDSTHSSKAFQLFEEFYGKKKVSSIDEKKAPKELYNSYFNMRLALERKNSSGSLFKKYMNMLDKSFEDKLEKGKEQDQKLKTKYYELAQVMVKKKLENENEKLYQ